MREKRKAKKLLWDAAGVQKGFRICIRLNILLHPARPVALPAEYTINNGSAKIH